MVATLPSTNQVQTWGHSVPAFRTAVQDTPDEHPNESARCPQNDRISQVIRRIHLRDGRGTARSTSSSGEAARRRRAPLFHSGQPVQDAHEGIDQFAARTLGGRSPTLGVAVKPVRIRIADAAFVPPPRAVAGSRAEPSRRRLPDARHALDGSERRMWRSLRRSERRRTLCGEQHRQDRGVGVTDRVDADPAHHRRDSAVGFGLHPRRAVLQAQVRQAG